MQEQRTLRLFKRGPAAEVRLALFVLLSVVLLITDARWTVLEPARQALSLVIYPFQRAVMAPANVVQYVDTWMNATALVHSEKEALQRQRIELAQLSTHAAQLAAENEQLRRLLQVADTVTQPAVAVEVFYEPPNAFNRRLVFNKGSAQGIRAGMPVIDEGGVVGQVVRVTPYTAEAALITDDKVSIPVQVLRNGLRLVAFGGHAASKIEARYLTNEVDLQVGDILITSGIGGLFPAGLPVAEVESLEFDPATGFAVAVGQPLSHPERYQHFLVLLVEEPNLQLQDSALLHE
ncbi:MAG TPA: rod shape-determining protein MreC [Paenalcaligenes hominis]|uniref:Cell shape-determining protein MreC n=1 Tax=Paenalcaligenes hominis TaxID=643674 RepID=A0A1U9JZZ8_9BURK|nr:rod shape-determining protein MreC [Paenalcaligenes hominis]AQS51347.1 rod shape-determining protein MreC [Paenalcaligenes hominis]NJB65620.1 rod shape-determining protein MreC [Paenalcaligenes hominis]GGE64370.1 cell shape-determining protein MreC [Paenalcaligenes hominis]HJH23024.1 rod shape-determining protein MreC [Paenalcaligenes hominis]